MTLVYANIAISWQLLRFNSLKKHFPQIYRFKRFENGLEKKFPDLKFFPLILAENPCFSLISLTGKSLQIFPWIPWFPWSVGTLDWGGGWTLLVYGWQAWLLYLVIFKGVTPAPRTRSSLYPYLMTHWLQCLVLQTQPHTTPRTDVQSEWPLESDFLHLNNKINEYSDCFITVIERSISEIKIDSFGLK